MSKAVSVTRSPKGCNDEEFVRWLENYKPTHMYREDRQRAYNLAGKGWVAVGAEIDTSLYGGPSLAAAIRKRMVDQVVEKLQ